MGASHAHYSHPREGIQGRDYEHDSLILFSSSFFSLQDSSQRDHHATSRKVIPNSTRQVELEVQEVDNYVEALHRL